MGKNKEPRDKIVQVMFSESEQQAIDQHAEKLDMSRSALIRHALRQIGALPTETK